MPRIKAEKPIKVEKTTPRKPRVKKSIDTSVEVVPKTMPLAMPTKISDMLRQTADNTTNLMVQIADHIDQLEDKVAYLERCIHELVGTNPNE